MLTDDQIQKIDFFFEESGLEYYDLRRELVDHVSQSIEEKMKENNQLSFETACSQEIKKFNKKYLTEQNLNASQNYSPLKEWKYFNWQRIIRFVGIYLFLISPVLFLKASRLYYLEILYAATGMVIWIALCVAFSKKYKTPKKKTSLYQPYSLFELACPTILFAYFLFKYISGAGTLQANPSVARFEIVAFLVLFCILALLASQHLKKQTYDNVKNLYPFLFKD